MNAPVPSRPDPSVREDGKRGPGFHIRKSKIRRRWWVTLVASNGEVLSHSEQLNSHQAAFDNIAAQRKAARSTQVHDGG